VEKTDDGAHSPHTNKETIYFRVKKKNNNNNPSRDKDGESMSKSDKKNQQNRKLGGGRARMTSDEGKTAGVRKGNTTEQQQPLEKPNRGGRNSSPKSAKKTRKERGRLALASEINVRSSLTLHFALITGKSAKKNAREK